LLEVFATADPGVGGAEQVGQKPPGVSGQRRRNRRIEGRAAHLSFQQQYRCAREQVGGALLVAVVHQISRRRGRRHVEKLQRSIGLDPHLFQRQRCGQRAVFNGGRQLVRELFHERTHISPGESPRSLDQLEQRTAQ